MISGDTKENPMTLGAQAAWDATFREQPLEVKICPRCKAEWRKYPGGADHNFVYFDWDCVKIAHSTHAYTTTQTENNQPIIGAFCYSCAFESAPLDTLREYCETVRKQGFAKWLIDLPQDHDELTENALAVILGYFHQNTDRDDQKHIYRNYIEDTEIFADEFRAWRTWTKGE